MEIKCLGLKGNSYWGKINCESLGDRGNSSNVWLAPFNAFPHSFPGLFSFFSVYFCRILFSFQCASISSRHFTAFLYVLSCSFIFPLLVFSSCRIFFVNTPLGLYSSSLLLLLFLFSLNFFSCAILFFLYRLDIFTSSAIFKHIYL